ncbi:hypothetical protein V6N13_090926 [Hibiscus sabdariffa]
MNLILENVKGQIPFMDFRESSMFIHFINDVSFSNIGSFYNTLNHLHRVVLIYDEFKETWESTKIEVDMNYVLEGGQETCAHSNSNHSLNEGFQELHALTSWHEDSKGHREETHWSLPIRRENLIKEG